MAENGHAALDLATAEAAVRQMNPVVKLLEDVLAQARTGLVTTVAVIAVDPKHAIMTAYAGGQTGDIYVGTGLLQNRALHDIANPPRPQSAILQPGR